MANPACCRVFLQTRRDGHYIVEFSDSISEAGIPIRMIVDTIILFRDRSEIASHNQFTKALGDR